MYMHIHICGPHHTVGTLASLWRKRAIEKMVFSLPEQNDEASTFKVKYDKTQSQLQSIAAMDDLLSGFTYNYACIEVLD